MTNQKKPIARRSDQKHFSYYLLPLIFIVTILPLIVKFKITKTNLTGFDWFTNEAYTSDFFLYYKQWWFVAVCVILLITLLVKRFFSEKKLSLSKIFIPLLSYVALAFLSTIVSKYRSFGFQGAIGQFENIFCLIGYGLVVYYAYYIIDKERDLRTLINATAVGALLQGIIGTCQTFGMDYFSSSFFKSLIYAGNESYASTDLSIVKGRAFTTLFNPNYVGVYTGIMISLFVILLFYTKNKYEIALYGATIITCAISLIASQSKAGIIGLVFSILCFAVLSWRRIIHYWYLIIPAITAFILTCSLYSLKNDISLLNDIKTAIVPQKEAAPELSSINTYDDRVEITLNNETLVIKLSDTHDFLLYDTAGNPVTYGIYQTNSDNIIVQPNYGVFTNTPLINFTDPTNAMDFCIIANDKTWAFSQKVNGKEYLYYNRYNKFSPLKTMNPSFLRGYENFATHRGYIWSRTLPLLKSKILLGSGADSFIFSFPQYDYVSMMNYGFEGKLISKPHCYYLQVAVQTGVLSLICLLAFFVLYIIQAIRLYRKCSFTSITEKIGLSVLFAILNFLFTSLTNDSSIAIMPVIWVLIGIGVTANHLVAKSRLENKN